VEIGTIIFNVIVFIRIRIFKYFGQSQDSADSQAKQLKNAFLVEMKQQSLMSFSLSICNMVNLASSKIGLSLLNKIEPSKLSKNGGIILAHYNFIPCMMTIFYLITFYAKHAPLRKAVLNKIKDLRNVDEITC
jgi:hypothetical protein